jgi:hypothetical protein
MVHALVMWCAVLGATRCEVSDAPAGKHSDRSAYEAAQKQAGRDAGAHLKLALWCEAHGLSAERMKHLALAVLNDPSNALARGLMGLVSYHGQWKSPDEISRTIHEDPKQRALVREYVARRARTPEMADGHATLALWCEQNGLKLQAIAHFHQVLLLDPTRELAWKHLGFKKVGGRWIKPEVVAEAKRQVEAQKNSSKHWKPLLERWRDGLASKDKSRRASAEKALADVTDPRAVPEIWWVYARGDAARQMIAVRLLGQIDSPGASRALAMLALLSRSAEVRQVATQSLRRRDAREFAPLLIAMLRDPVKYEVQDVKGPGSSGELFVKKKDVNLKRLYSPPPLPDVMLMPGDSMALDANGLPVVLRVLDQYIMPATWGGAGPGIGDTLIPALPTAAQISTQLGKAGLPPNLAQKLGATVAQNASAAIMNLGGPRGQPLVAEELVNRQLQIPVGLMMMQAQIAAQVAQQQLAGDVQAIDAYNAPILDTNRRLRVVLAAALGTDVGDDRAAWQKWLVDLLGYAYAPQKSSNERTTIIEEVPLAYQPQAAPIVSDQPVAVQIVSHSCFGAGTPVRTLEGVRPIESIRIGDQVLTQNPKTGELKYEPLIAVYHNPPNATLRIDLGNETVVATGIHRFWKAGKGWTMARELKRGDALRTLGGTASVKAVETERTQPVFNLRVAEGESFFVGEAAVLAHDNSLINPTPDPFDAVPTLGESTTP